MPSKGNRNLAMALIALAVVFAAAAIFYFAVKTNFLADTTGRHWKHGLLASGLAVLCLIGANVVRPKRV